MDTQREERDGERESGEGGGGREAMFSFLVLITTYSQKFFVPFSRYL